MIDITTCLFNNIDDKIFSCLIMIDLRKAFDTVSHERLLSKFLNAVDAEMGKISNRMVTNKLTINPKKSSILTIQPSQ